MDNILNKAKLKFGKVEPYDIQISFMRDLITSFEEGKIGFFESPTGTGKSMSVLSSAIAFIQNKNKDIKNTYTLDNGEFSDSEFDITDAPKKQKLLICTRTHSQIKELVNELKRPGMLINPNSIQKQTRAVSLASRRQLCINDSYDKLSQNELNNICGSSCEYHPNNSITKSEIGMKDKLTRLVLENPFDIEDLKSQGRSQRCCPYFASRAATKLCDIILMPYQSLFQEQTREAFKLSLVNSYIVIDEGHNLIDALNNMYSVKITEKDLTVFLSSLQNYKERLQNNSINVGDTFMDDSDGKETDLKVSVENKSKMVKNQIFIDNIDTIYNLCVSLCSVFNIKSASYNYFRNKKVVEMNMFQQVTKTSDINTIALVDWAQSNTLCYRLCSKKKDAERIELSSAINRCLSFIDAMGRPDQYGRVIITQSRNVNQIEYMLLNPSMIFYEITKAKSVLIVGGTLQPFEDIKNQLFDKKHPELNERLFIHCNGHVIPPKNSLTLSLSNGPLTVQDFSYTYKNISIDEQSKLLKDNICIALKDLSKIIPGGIILFFTSYEFMNQVWDHLHNNQTLKNEIEFHKFLLKETKDDPKKLESTMRIYKSHIDNRKNDVTGAILFAVMNGKLSEGINFSNDYCRCVVCVGMPYPNERDNVIIQRKNYYKENNGLKASEEYIQNVCMRVVNQSIGRSFRHKNDFAVAILFDSRYKSLSNKLPDWILRNYKADVNWKRSLQLCREFFESKMS